MTAVIHCLTVDGVDFNTWEKKHECNDIDKTDCTYKVNNWATKYEIDMVIFKPRCVWIYCAYPEVNRTWKAFGMT